MDGGDNRDRTGDLRLAKAALSQLSYIPTFGKAPGWPACRGRRFACLREVAFARKAQLPEGDRACFGGPR